MPHITQVAIGCPKGEEDAFERNLYIIRKRFSNEIKREEGLEELSAIYICNLSSKTIVYKGMLAPAQVFPFFPDLENPEYEAHLAMVHSRFPRTLSQAGTELNLTDLCLTTEKLTH